MPTFPNTGLAQDLAPFYGSCKVELSEDNGVNWINVGLARGVVFNEVPEIADIQADNGPDLDNYIAVHKVEITFNSLEFYLPTLAKLRGGIDLGTTVAGTLVTATDEYATGVISDFESILLQNQGGSATLAAITEIRQTTDSPWGDGGATVILADTGDYVVFVDPNNHVGFVGIDTFAAGSFDAAKALRAKYVYRNIASRKLSSGGLASITAKWFRLTNKQIVSSVAKYRIITLYSAAMNAGLNLAFKSANETDPILEIPITLQAELDTTRTEGDQLFLIEDQVAVA